MNELRCTRAGRQFANTASTSSLEESGTELFSRSSSTETIISRESTVTDEETSERLGQKPAKQQSSQIRISQTVFGKLYPREADSRRTKVTAGTYNRKLR